MSAQLRLPLLMIKIVKVKHYTFPLFILPLHLHLHLELVEVGLLPVEGGHHPHHVRVVLQELRNLLSKRGDDSHRPVEPLVSKPVCSIVGCWGQKTVPTKVVSGCHCCGCFSHTELGWGALLLFPVQNMRCATVIFLRRHGDSHFLENLDILATC